MTCKYSQLIISLNNFVRFLKPHQASRKLHFERVGKKMKYEE